MLIAGQCAATFVCGDDEAARKIVAELEDEIDMQPIDAGPLNASRYIQPAAMLLVHLAYTRGLGTRIGVTLLRERAGALA